VQLRFAQMGPTVSVSIEAEHAPIMEEWPIGDDSVALPGPQEHYSNDDPLCSIQPYGIFLGDSKEHHEGVLQATCHRV